MTCKWVSQKLSAADAVRIIEENLVLRGIVKVYDWSTEVHVCVLLTIER